MPHLSLIIPVFNEAQNLPLLFESLRPVLAPMDYEVILVDDGSRDNSFEVIREFAVTDPRIKAIAFNRNYGQTAAINAGIRAAEGEVIVLMDSDLENDPADIPILLAKLEEGYDVVSGWRQGRWEGQFLTRQLPSRTANRLISWVSGVKLNDYGCTLKAYRASVLKDVALYGEMHRFIPVYCQWQGGRIGELPVNYRPRQYGKSNYGMFRTYRVLLDLLLMRFLDRFMTRPIHFFGAAGLLSILVSFLMGSYAVWLKIRGTDFILTPMPMLTAIFFTIGVVMILMGVLAEMITRTYYESQHKTPFGVRESVNL